MNVYFAPLEGVTDAIFRRAHHECFGGIEKYYIPFICPTMHMVLTPREKRAISRESNAGVPVVPQVLTKNAEHFVWAANSMLDEGHNEVNLNLGCPSGTVTAKGKGAGMLRDTGALRAFLDEIFARSPIRISIKTRVGYASADEWPGLLEIFSDYPVHELIVHPRTREEFYSGAPHRELMRDAAAKCASPLVYNGDLTSAAECRAFMEAFPGTAALMLGRGLITNPAVARELNGGAPISLRELRRFHDRLYADYTAQLPKNAVLGRMHEIMQYISCGFEDCAKARKAIRKAATAAAYEDAANRLFEEYRLCESPCFRPAKLISTAG